MVEKIGFNVVFEGTDAPNSNHPGIRTWTYFASQEDFDQAMLEGRYGDRVIATGVSDEEAKKIASEARPIDFINAAFLSANKGGVFNERVLQSKLWTFERLGLIGGGRRDLSERIAGLLK